MKKVFSLLMTLCLLLATLPLTQAVATGDGLGETFDGSKPAKTDDPGESLDLGKPTAQPAPEASSALFDEGVRDITCAPYGNQVDFAQIGGWTIRKGYLEEQELYCLIGQAPDGTPQALTDALPAYIVPSGDAFLYYGPDARGEMHWVSRRPDEEPEHLELDASDELICADSEYIWYYTVIGEEYSLRRLARDSGKTKVLGRVEGFPLTLQEDGGILLFNQAYNRVESWKDGKITTLYAPEEDLIYTLASVGKNVWVELEQGFGLLEDGALSWTLPGGIEQMAGTTDQFVFLIALPDSDEFDVILFNEQYRAYARVGHVPASEDTLVELRPDQRLTVWSSLQRFEFDIPPAEQWIPYGHSDVPNDSSSARQARGNTLEDGADFGIALLGNVDGTL